MKTKLTKLAAVASTLLIGASMLMPLAQAANTTAQLVASAGAFTVATTDASLDLDDDANSMTPFVLSNAVQTVTGNVNDLVITNLKGDGLAWNVSMTASHLGIDSSSITKAYTAGSGISMDNVVLAGTFNGLKCNTGDGFDYTDTTAATRTKSCGNFLIDVDTTKDVGGVQVPDQVTVTDPAGSTYTANTNLGTNVLNLQTNETPAKNIGLTITFGGTTDYASDDQITLKVDAFPYTSLTITPASLTNVNSSIVGLSLGNSGLITAATPSSEASSDGDVILNGAVNSGPGVYGADVGLSWALGRNAKAATYKATLTYTIG